MGADSPIRVVLADDHDLFRSGLRDLLAGEGIEVIGEAADGDRAVELIVAAAPDVVVMDIHMPGQTGIEATREVRRRSPATKVLILSISEGEGDIVEAIIAGACGYLLKDSAVEEIAEGVRAAVRGEAMLSARIAARLLDRLRTESWLGDLPAEDRAGPTERELEVLGLLAAGRDMATIAADLDLTPETARNHLSNLLAKVEVRERIRAAVEMVRGRA